MITTEERIDLWYKLYRGESSTLRTYAQVIEDLKTPTLDFVVPKGTIVQVYRR